jgi:membrane fusion protein (multidrug efflux system)
VELGELAGPWQVLRDGIQDGDRVVVGDPSDLKPGTPVKPQPFDGDAEALMQEKQEEQQEKKKEAQEEQQQAQGEGANKASGTDDESSAASDEEDAS